MQNTAARTARKIAQALAIAFALTLPTVIAHAQTIPPLDNTTQPGLFTNHVLVGIGATTVECPTELHAQLVDSFGALTCFNYGYEGSLLQREVDLHSEYENPVAFITQMAWSSPSDGIWAGGFVLDSGNVVITFMESIGLGLFGVTKE